MQISDEEEAFQVALRLNGIPKQSEALARKVWNALPALFLSRAATSPDDVVSMIYRLASYRAADYRRTKARL